MTPIQEKIVAAVDKADGSASWQEAIADLSYPESQRALVEIRELERTKVLNRVVKHDKETGKTMLTINRFAEPVAEEAAAIESAD